MMTNISALIYDKKPLSDFLRLSTTFYDLSVSRNPSTKTKYANFAPSRTEWSIKFLQIVKKMLWKYELALVLSRDEYLSIFHRQQPVSTIQQFLASQKSFKFWPVEKLDEKNFEMQFYRSGLLVSDGTEVPRTIHVLKTGVAKILRKVSEDVFVQEIFQRIQKALIFYYNRSFRCFFQCSNICKQKQ